MKYLKMLGIAAIAAMAMTAFTAGSASATTLEVEDETQLEVTIQASIASGKSALLARTDGSFANTCTESNAHGIAETTNNNGDWTVEGPLTGHNGENPEAGLNFKSCTRPVTVHNPGTLKVEHIEGTTNGTVTSTEAQVTVGSIFGTLNCQTGSGTHIGTITGASTGGHAVMHINGVINCGFLVPSAKWTGEYIITSPTGLGVEA